MLQGQRGICDALVSACRASTIALSDMFTDTRMVCHRHCRDMLADLARATRPEYRPKDISKISDFPSPSIPRSPRYGVRLGISRHIGA